MVDFALNVLGFESWPELIFFSTYEIEKKIPEKIESSDFCLSTYALSALSYHSFSLCCKQFSFC